ncbi:MAG: hypothetical protein WD850_00680 [Candidatus Spechtbacterales bacterium]
MRVGILITGIALSLVASLTYYGSGFQPGALLLWLSALFLCAAFFYLHDGSTFRLNMRKSDVLALSLLVLLFAPLYFVRLYTIPFQINTDEVTIMYFQRLNVANPDIFGISNYLDFPSLIFIATGWMQELLGGVGLFHARIVHAGFGITIIVLAYVFFRQFFPVFWAAFAAVVLGANHALLAISRMAMRDNSGLLVGLASLAFLYYGYFHKRTLHTFVGGGLAGLCFYVYFPARAVLFIWLAYLVSFGMLLLLRRRNIQWVFQAGAVAVLGFFIVSGLLHIAELKNTTDSGEDFYRERFLVFEEGRIQQQYWVNAPTIAEGVMVNIKNGLTTFNNNVSDQSFIYPNANHGFVDPLSGVLLWIGIGIILVKAYRNRGFKQEDLFMLIGFFSLYISYAFIINKSPNYTRLLIILPFVSFFITQAAKIVSEKSSELLGTLSLSRRVSSISLGVLLAITIVSLNVLIFGDFARKGLAEGNDVGGTARYIEARKDAPGHQFVLVADQTYPYYSWGEKFQWEDWLGFFVGENQSYAVLDSESFIEKLPDSNATIFMNELVWLNYKRSLKEKYKEMKLHNIKTDGSLIAIEV